MVRPHTFIITASQGERTLFGTIFFVQPCLIKYLKGNRFLSILSGRRHTGILVKDPSKATHARPRLPPFKAVQ